MPTILNYLEHLIRFESITPYDYGCQDYMIEILRSFGFRCQRFDKNNVNNFYAEIGDQGPRLIFAGHTDVVEPGPLQAWRHHPFKLSQEGDTLYGRGIADMKGALACMLALAQTWSQQGLAKQGILGFLITSGEEGDDYLDGTPIVMQALAAQQINIDYCIVGEPSASTTTGDTIKVGRRGSLTGNLKIRGKQGHVAYPQLAENAIHKSLGFLSSLVAKKWDDGDENFPPTSFQITKFHHDKPAANIIPGTVDIQFNLRFNPLYSSMRLQTEIAQMALAHNLDFDCAWKTSGEPFLTQPGKLLETTKACILAHLAQEPILSTSGGTSDARFIAPYGIEVLELGLPNHSIHQVNECVQTQDLDKLYQLYLDISQRLLLASPPH